MVFGGVQVQDVNMFFKNSQFCINIVDVVLDVCFVLQKQVFVDMEKEIEGCIKVFEVKCVEYEEWFKCCNEVLEKVDEMIVMIYLWMCLDVVVF